MIIYLRYVLTRGSKERQEWEAEGPGLQNVTETKRETRGPVGVWVSVSIPSDEESEREKRSSEPRV